MDSVTVGSSPPWVDAVVSITPVEILDTKEIALIAVHPDGCVTAWTPQDPSILLMRKKFLKVTCVTSAYKVIQHSSLIWFGGISGIQCYRARRHDGRYIHLQLLYILPLKFNLEVKELQTNGNSIIAIIKSSNNESSSLQVFFWSSIGHVANAQNITKEAEYCISSCIFGTKETILDSAIGNVSSVLLTDNTIWIGCTNGAIIVIDIIDIIKNKIKLSYKLRTAGTCTVTSLALLNYQLNSSIVVSGLENGDIIIWSIKGVNHLGHYFEHSSSISSITYLPWNYGICTISKSREIIFWEWKEETKNLIVIERGILENDMGSTPIKYLCVVSDTKILACAAEKSHILRWRIHKKPISTINNLSLPLRVISSSSSCSSSSPPPSPTSSPSPYIPTSTSTTININPFLTNITVTKEELQLMNEEIQELRSKCQKWQELYESSEVRRSNAEHEALINKSNEENIKREIKEIKEIFKFQTQNTLLDFKKQSEIVENNYLIENLRIQILKLQEYQNELLNKINNIEEERKKEKILNESEINSLIKEKKTLEAYNVMLETKLNKKKELIFSKPILKEEKSVNTDNNCWNIFTPTYSTQFVEKGIQVSLSNFSPYRESDNYKIEDKNLFSKYFSQNSLVQEQEEKEESDKDICQKIGFNSTISVPLLDAFKGEATPVVSSEENLIINQKVSSHFSSNNLNYLLSKPSDEKVSKCIVETLQVQLSLMEVLLRNHRTASASSDPLLIQSTNILTDVYLIIRDLLGIDIASTIVYDALKGRPQISEREVICKLFFAICQRYLTLLSRSSP